MSIVSRLRSYVGGEDPNPMLAMFGLNAVDELDNATFIWIGPTIAAAFGAKVADFAVINVLVLLVAPMIAIPVSLAADRRARMPIALACAATWGVFSVLSGLSFALWFLVLARLGSSLGRTVSYPVQLSLMADFYSPKARASALGVHALANNVGSIFGALGAGALAALFGWRAPFFVLAVPTFIVIIYAARVHEPQRGAFERVVIEERQPLRDVYTRLYAIRSVRYIWFAYAWIYGMIVGATITLPFYFKDYFGIGDFGLGVIGSIGGVGAIIATLVGARLAQTQLNISAAAGVKWIARLVLAIVGMLVLFAVTPTLWLAIPILFVISALFGLAAPLFATVMTLIAPPELRSSAYSIGQLYGLVGTVFALIISAISQAYGYGWGYLFAAAIALRAAFHIYTAATFVNDDVARLDPAHVDEVARTDTDGRKVILETKDLTVHYDGVQVLFGVDLIVREGEILALLGTNGAGKSTVLNAVCGLVEPSGGNVWLDGVPTTGEPAERAAERGLVQAPGGRGIFPGLTVRENLTLGAFLIRGEKEVAAARTESVLDIFPALRPLLHVTAGALSGGQRQQLVLAQAFLLKPRVLLIDELSLGLAPVIVQDLLQAVRLLNAEGVTIVLVEQSVNVALTLADRAYFLEKGEVRFEGPTKELLDRPDLLRSVFLGGASTTKS